MELGKYEIEQVEFCVFTEPPGRVGTYIGNLNHAGELAVHKKRCFYKQLDLIRPWRATLVEESHQIREPPRHGFIVVLNQQPMPRRNLILEKAVKARYNLGEPFLKWWHPRWDTPKTPLYPYTQRRDDNPPSRRRPLQFDVKLPGAPPGSNGDKVRSS